MLKSLFIAEKPSVAREFANALKENMASKDGYMESDHYVVTWCVGHLVTMSYPESYDEKYRKWSMDTLPFLPDNYKYEVIPGVKKQFNIVKSLLARADVGTVFVCTDSGREGEYIYRLTAQMAGVKDKVQKRVWIDSQTEEEIIRGIKEAKSLSEYDNLADSAYLRAKEDYLMGINFSRVLSLKYSCMIMNYLDTGYKAVSAGRVMTCVLGMVVKREREIRNFKKTSFYRIIAELDAGGTKLTADWRAAEGSRYEGSPLLYNENGFLKRQDAEKLIEELKKVTPPEAVIEKTSRKKEKKYPPFLYNLAELQNDCSRRFKISPDQTLNTVQALYEKKLITYPRTEARVLSSAVAKEISGNIRGLLGYLPFHDFAEHILKSESYKNIHRSKYTNDKLITDHYAIIPTGKGLKALDGLSALQKNVYDLIAARFLSIFYPPAEYSKVSITFRIDTEPFFCGCKMLTQKGYLAVAGTAGEKDDQEKEVDTGLFDRIASLKKGGRLPICGYSVKEGETTPPKRYTSGTMILAMENAGQLIEDEELRAQIKGSGIGTSATRAEILKKLTAIEYLKLNKKTQVITPTQMGEMVYEVVNMSIRSLLNPALTASWEKGLMYVAEGTVRPEEYMKKLEEFVSRHINGVKQSGNASALKEKFDGISFYYNNARKVKK